MLDMFLHGSPEEVSGLAKTLERNAKPIPNAKGEVRTAAATDEELLNRAFPIAIMHGFQFDPNQTDEIPGEWELISMLWRRIK